MICSNFTIIIVLFLKRIKLKCLTDNIFKCFFFSYFSEKKQFDMSCELSFEIIHMKCQALFFEREKKKNIPKLSAKIFDGRNKCY